MTRMLLTADVDPIELQKVSLVHNALYFLHCLQEYSQIQHC